MGIFQVDLVSSKGSTLFLTFLGPGAIGHNELFQRPAGKIRSFSSVIRVFDFDLRSLDFYLVENLDFIQDLCFVHFGLCMTFGVPGRIGIILSLCLD